MPPEDFQKQQKLKCTAHVTQSKKDYIITMLILGRKQASILEWELTVTELLTISWDNYFFNF